MGVTPQDGYSWVLETVPSYLSAHKTENLRTAAWVKPSPSGEEELGAALVVQPCHLQLEEDRFGFRCL